MENPPARSNFSVINEEEILSSANPPYSSGISALNKPKSPAFFSNSTECSNSWFSNLSTKGITSPATKSSVVFAIILCSSEKSSGVITSSPFKSSIKNAPPLNNLSFVSPIHVIPFYHIFNSLLLSHHFKSQKFKNTCGSHTSTNAHGYHTILYIPAFHFMDKTERPLRSSHDKGMSKCNGTTIHIHDGRIRIQSVNNSYRLFCKRFVQFKQTNIRKVRSGNLQCLRNRFNRTDSHYFRFHSCDSKRMEFSHWFQSFRLCFFTIHY